MHSYYFLQCPVISSFLRPVTSSAPYSLSLCLSVYVVPLTWKTLFHTHKKLKRRMLQPARHIYAITWSPRFQTPPIVCTYNCWRHTHTQISGSENAPQSRCRVSWRARLKVWATSRLGHRVTCVRSPIRLILQHEKPQCHKIKQLITSLHVAPLFHTRIVIFQHDPKARWCIRPILARIQKIPSKQRSCSWIHEQPFPLPHYCAIGELDQRQTATRFSKIRSSTPAAFKSAIWHTGHLFNLLTPCSRALLEKLTGS